jgi:hypothetical protein
MRSRYERFRIVVRRGPAAGRWLFVWVFLAQLGHLIEHISQAIQGQGLLGTGFDNELSHLVFNGLIAIGAVAIVVAYPRNPWAYPLGALSIFHGIEHVYIFHEFLITGISNGPGLLAQGGAIGLIPLDRLDLHNVYNGTEVILMVLGLNHELWSAIAEGLGEIPTGKRLRRES